MDPGFGQGFDLQDRSNIAPSSGNEEIMLGVLTSLENNREITQRSLAKELGIAVGLANAYVKRCIQKGFIKISQIPPRRYTYYLTPKGFAEKSRLTVEYLQISFEFLRDARNQIDQILETCASQGRQKIALVGAGELGEIALLCARGYPVTVVGFVDRVGAGSALQALPIFGDPVELTSVEAFILTDVSSPQETFDWLTDRLPSDRIFVPKMLNVSKRHPELAE